MFRCIDAVNALKLGMQFNNLIYFEILSLQAVNSMVIFQRIFDATRKI